MKTSSIVSLVGALCVAGCAALPGSNAYPSPGSLTPSTKVASQGSVFFVSDTTAWELTQPPDQERTVVLKTVDGGSHWKIWGIAPEPGAPVVFNSSEILLSNANHLLRSSDGSHWTVMSMPVYGNPTFLPDMRHGWLGGFPLYVPAESSPAPPSGKGGSSGAPGKGGSSSATGKGGGGGAARGKGGSSSGSSPTTCQAKGCQPISLWSTTDGGATWRLLLNSTVSVSGGPMYFFSPTVGMIEQNTTILLTRDGGVTWRARTLSIPGLAPDQPTNDLAPTMFDTANGLLPIQAGTGLYLSRTADGGLTWSQPQKVSDCAGCAGTQMALLDDRHWIDYSHGVNLTADGGQTWRKVATTNPGDAVNDVEVVTGPSSAVFVLSPGVFASETTDWGAHWRAVPLPDIYPTYRGFDTQGGWTS